MRYGKLVIRALLPSIDHGGQRVLATCDCGGLRGCKDCTGVIETRLNRLQSGETTSCGCVKVTRFKEFVGRAVDRLPEGTAYLIWADHFTGRSRYQVAANRGIALAVVDESIRRYQRQLDTMLANGIAGQIYFAAGEKGGLEAAADSQGLPLIAARFLAMAVSRKRPVADDPTHPEWLAEGLEYCFRKISERKDDYRLGIRSGEFTFRELRRSKGVIVGRYAADYLRACELLKGRLETHQMLSFTSFVSLVNETLTARRGRQKAGARRVMKDRRKGAADQAQRELYRQLNSEPERQAA